MSTVRPGSSPPVGGAFALVDHDGRPVTNATFAAFRVFARRRADPEDPDGDAVPHTAITYVLDPDGVCVDHFTDALNADEVAERLQTLIV